MQRRERINRMIEDREKGRAAMEESAKILEGPRVRGNENHILNSSVASTSDIIPLDTTYIFGLAKTVGQSR